jgi:hypothetical protein
MAKAKPLWRGRQWRVTGKYLETHDGKYFIEKNRLAENIADFPWPRHMAEKTWVDVPDFIEAWKAAIDIHKAKVTPEQIANAERLARKGWA